MVQWMMVDAVMFLFSRDCFVFDPCVLTRASCRGLSVRLLSIGSCTRVRGLEAQQLHGDRRDACRAGSMQRGGTSKVNSQHGREHMRRLGRVSETH